MEPIQSAQNTVRASKTAQTQSAHDGDEALQALSRKAKPTLIIPGLVVLAIVVVTLIVLGARNNTVTPTVSEEQEIETAVQETSPATTSTPEPSAPVTFNSYQTTCGSVPYTDVYLQADTLDESARAAFDCFLSALDKCEAASFAIAGTDTRPGAVYSVEAGTASTCPMTQVIDTATTSKTCLLPRNDYANVRTSTQARNEPQAAFAGFVLPAMLASSYTNNTTGETVTLECVRAAI